MVRARAVSSVTIDTARLAAELLRALRGRRSRPAFSRYLGYKSNVVQRWESRECWPTAAGFFGLCERMRLDTRAIARRFLHADPAWLTDTPLSTRKGVALFLGELRGKNRIADTAARSGFGRSSVSRWFKGSAEPKLPEFLALVEVCSRRLVDLAIELAPPDQLPSVRARWKSLSLSRDLAYEHPLSHAVLRALELAEYRRQGALGEDFLARRLDLDVGVVQAALDLLRQSEQVRRTRGRWTARQAVVDTGTDPLRARALKLRWAKEAITRLERGTPGHFGYSVFAVSRKDLRRLADIQQAYVREMQSVIAASDPSECVGLYCVQLLDLSVAGENAFRAAKRSISR